MRNVRFFRVIVIVQGGSKTVAFTLLASLFIAAEIRNDTVGQGKPKTELLAVGRELRILVRQIYMEVSSLFGRETNNRQKSKKGVIRA